MFRNIKLLYIQFQACTTNCGEISDWFYLTRGLYQGNPLSSTLFILIVEVMGHKIKGNDKINGICVNAYHFIMAQFADDTNLFLKFEQETIQEATDNLVLFENNTGLKHYYEKSTVYRIGSLKKSNAKYYTSKELAWTNEPKYWASILVKIKKIC